jgi:predicted nuclease of predicted toxin-antitoxin system
MKLLANENFPGEAVEALRQEGHDVAWVRTESPGARDDAVLARAQTEQRILVTFDKDFGELAFRAGLPAACGVILFRISAPSAIHVVQAAVAALESRQDWDGHFSVIEDGKIRMTALPKP